MYGVPSRPKQLCFFLCRISVSSRISIVKPVTDPFYDIHGFVKVAPYWFEIDVTAYVGNDSRTALSFMVEYELLITQKLVLQPRIETNLYGQDDPSRGIGSGISDMTAGIRLRYEIKREFAPYIGVEYTSKYGNAANIALAAGASVNDTRFVAGLRFWY